MGQAASPQHQGQHARHSRRKPSGLSSRPGGHRQAKAGGTNAGPPAEASWRIRFRAGAESRLVTATHHSSQAATEGRQARLGQQHSQPVNIQKRMPRGELQGQATGGISTGQAGHRSSERATGHLRRPITTTATEANHQVAYELPSSRPDHRVKLQQQAAPGGRECVRSTRPSACKHLSEGRARAHLLSTKVVTTVGRAPQRFALNTAPTASSAPNQQWAASRPQGQGQQPAHSTIRSTAAVTTCWGR